MFFYHIHHFTSLVILLQLFYLSSCELFGGGDPSGSVGGGEVVWKADHQEETLTVATQPAIDGDYVYFIQDAQLKSYSLADGDHRWSTQLCSPGRDCDYSRTIMQTESRLFIDQGYRIKAFNKTSGALAWNTEITDEGKETSGIGRPIMSQDEDFLYAGRKGYVIKIRKSNGQIAQRYPLDRLVPEGVVQGSTEPIISPYGDNILYVPTSYYDRTTPGEEEFGANMFAFEVNTGELIWERRVEYKISDTTTPTKEDSLLVSPPIYDIDIQDSLIVALQGRAVVTFNRYDGTISWYNNFPASGFDVGLAVTNKNIYAASVGRYAHKLNLINGDELWRRDIEFSNTSIPTVRDGRMYFNNSGGGGIWVLDTADGSVIYNQNPPNYSSDNFDVYISSLAVGQGYMVNVGSKAVYCLKVP